jgi:hypothetical protein
MLTSGSMPGVSLASRCALTGPVLLLNSACPKKFLVSVLQLCNNSAHWMCQSDFVAKFPRDSWVAKKKYGVLFFSSFEKKAV